MKDSQLYNIKNIIFDWGGVITEIDFDATINAFKKYGINDFEKHYCKAYQSELFQAHEIGKITPDKFREELRKLIPVSVTDKEIDEAWFAMLLDTPPNNLEIIKSVKNEFNIYLLSNTNAIHVDMYDKIFEEKYNFKEKFRSLFIKAYYSHEIGMRKPDEDVFEYILSDSDLDPNETLFIDDSIQNISAAKNVGIKTYHIEGDNSIEKLFGND